MTYHLRNRLGYLCRQSFSWWRVGRNSDPFPFTCRNDIFFLNKESIMRLLRGFAQVSDALGCSFFSKRFLSFRLQRGCEQFVTGPELFFAVMNCIHKTFFFSGYHNVRCVCRFGKWWNRNFYPILFKNFHDSNFKNSSNRCSSRIRCHDLRFRKRSGKMCIPCIEE